MNAREQARYDMVKRVGVFGTTNIGGFPGTPKQLVLDLTTADTGLIDQIGQMAETQESGSGTFHGGSTSKDVLRDALRLELRGINRTAGAIAEATGDPGLMDNFRMPYGVSDITLVAKANAIADADAPMVAQFEEYGHSGSFVDELRAHITAFEGAEDVQDAGQQKASGATAGFGPLLKTALMKVKQLDAFVHNFYKTDAEKMGEWKTASHVERQSKKKTNPPPPTP